MITENRENVNTAFVSQASATLPAELTQLEQWVTWRYEPKPGTTKPDKVPYNPHTGHKASSTDPKTWGNFAAACAAAGRFDGIGFVVTEFDPYTGIDIDKCISNGVLTDAAQKVVDSLGSYTEITPSNNGVRLYVQAKKPGDRCKKTNAFSAGFDVEIYESGRFFTVTGNHLPGTPTTICERQRELNGLYTQLFAAKKTENHTEREQSASSAEIPQDDQVLLQRMFAARNGADVRALWGGDTSAHNGDASAADLALCNFLAFWTGCDKGRMDRLFRQSGLMRDKWDRNARSGETYGAGTIRMAIENTTKTYKSGHAPSAPTIKTESGPVDSATGEILEPPNYNDDWSDNGETEAVSSPVPGVDEMIVVVNSVAEAVASGAGDDAKKKDVAAAIKAALTGWVLDNIADIAALGFRELSKLKIALNAKGLAQTWLDRDLPNLIKSAKSEQRQGAVADDEGARYLVKGGRICQKATVTEDKDGETVTKIVYAPLCNFSARIAADLHLDDGEEITRQLAIVGTVDTGQSLPEITIPAKDFEAMQWPVANWGAMAMIETGKETKNRLRHAIQSLSIDTLEQRHAYTHTGWRVIDDRRVFLHAGGAVGMDGVKVSLPRQLENYRFPDDNAVDYVTAMRESIKLMDAAPKRISAPLWAVTYLGPLSEMILPVFVPSVEGGSGSFKSSHTAVFLNHYGAKFSEYAMPADWLATANSLEKLTFHAKDVLLIIDDLRPTTSPNEAKQLSDAVNRIVRAAGNRQGRGRLDSNSDFKRTYAPRGVVAMTAERKAAGLSVNSRIMTINVDPGDIDSTMLATAQKQRHVYAYAMRGFIEYVADNWDELSKVLPERVADIRALSNGNGQHKRLPNATAVIYTAFECAMNYAIEIGAISEDEAGRRIDECYQVLAEIADLQNEVTAAEDPALKFVRIVATLVAQDKAYILGAKGVGSEKVLTLGSDKGEKLGWHDGFNVYLLPGAYNTVCRYATSEGWSFPSDESTLRKELARQGYLGKTDGDRLTTKQRVPGEQGKPQSVIAIKHERFATFLGEMGVRL